MIGPNEASPKRAIVTERAIGSQSVEFEGPRVLEGCRDLAIPHMRSRFGGAWLVPQAHAADLEVWLEQIARVRIQVTL